MADTEPRTSADITRLAVRHAEADVAAAGPHAGRAAALVDLINALINDSFNDPPRPFRTTVPVDHAPETQTDAPTQAGLYWGFCEGEWQVVKLILCVDGDDGFCMHRLNQTGHLTPSDVQRWGPQISNFEPLNNEVNHAG